MKHRVSKAKFKIKTKSGKEVIVTGDHSCIVFRNGEQLTIKAKDINPKTDKILTVKSNKLLVTDVFMENYIFEDIDSIKQLDDFDNENVFDIEVNDDSHTFIGNDILVHNSVYTTYGTFFQCMTPKYQEIYKEDRAKLDWILKYNQEFHDKLNTEWCEAIFNPRHGNSIHNFELETVSRAGIYLKKKKYLKGLVFNKGKYLDHPKPSGTGIEIIKSTTPQLCRKILTELMEDLMFNYGTMSKSDYLIYFNNKLAAYKKEFYKAPVEDISQSVGIGNYKKYVLNDEDSLEFALKAPISVKGIARFNYLAHQNGQDNLKTYSGKIKYYRIRVGKKKDDVEMFGFPAGELPEWAPKMDKLSQWDKTIIEPINRFLEVMQIPLAQASDCVQLDLFSAFGM